MFSKAMREDGAKAKRLIVSQSAGMWAIAFHDGEWYAYPNDDYAEKYGMACFIADSEETVINAARAE